MLNVSFALLVSSPVATAPPRDDGLSLFQTTDHPFALKPVLADASRRRCCAAKTAAQQKNMRKILANVPAFNLCVASVARISDSGSTNRFLNLIFIGFHSDRK